MKKKIITKLFSIALALVMPFSSIVAFSDDVHCEYWYEGGPDCKIAWSSDENEHWKICIYHVDDKEDMNSHPEVDGTRGTHTFSDGKCTLCSRKDPNAATEEPGNKEDLAAYEELLMVDGALAYELSEDGSSLNIHITEMYEMLCLEYSMASGTTPDFSFEAAYAGDTLSLVLSKDTYTYTGEPIYPDVDLKKDLSGVLGHPYSLAGDVSFENNIEPGTATVKITIAGYDGNMYTLSKNFTIINGSTLETGDIDGNSSIDATDALYSLKAAAKMIELTESQFVAADVNEDNKVDASDALLILKYAAKIIDSFN